MDSDGNYDLSTVSEAGLDSKNYLADANVENISSDTVVVSGTGAGEYKLTDKTVFIELSSSDGFDAAYLNKLPSNSDRGIVTTMLYNNDGEILLIVTKAAATQSGDNNDNVSTEGIYVDVDGNNSITVTYIGAKPGNNAVVQAIREKLANVNGISVDKVTVEVSGSTYTFKAVGSFMTVTYEEFDINTVKPVVELDQTSATFAANVGGKVAKVTYNGTDSKVSYQWYSCSKDGGDVTEITETAGGHNNYTGSTKDTLNAEANMLSATGGDNNDGKYYVFCRVTFGEGSSATAVETGIVTISVTA